MKKRMFLCLMAMIVIGLNAYSQDVEDYEMRETTTDVLNDRTELSSDSQNVENDEVTTEVPNDRIEPSFNSQGEGDYEVITDVLNVRLEPSSNSKIIGKLKQKQVIPVIGINNDWAAIVFINDSGKMVDGYVKTEFLQLVIPNTVTETVKQEPESEIFQYIFLGIFALCLICYIIALVRTRQGKMITIVNWYDFALLVGPFILWIIAAISYDKNSESNIFSICLFILGGLSFLGSMIWSIIANKGSVFNMIVSVFAKLFVVMIVWLLVLYIIRPKTTQRTESINGKTYSYKLSAYEQAIEDEKHRKNTGIAIGLLGFLIFSLIASVNHKELTAALKSKMQDN
jgi:uncharacterized Tic20 family protein